MAILREHFIEGVPVSQVCERHQGSPAWGPGGTRLGAVAATGLPPV